MKLFFHISVVLLIALLAFTPFAVSGELMNGVNKSKEFWFYGLAVLITCLAFFYPAFKKDASIPFHWPDLFILLYYAYIAGHIFIMDPEKYYLDKFTIQTLWVLLYFVLKNFWYSINRRQTGRYIDEKVFNILRVLEGAKNYLWRLK